MFAERHWLRGRLDGRRGPARLLFGRMYEDWSVEASLFGPGDRVLCIASAGCTAMALAARGCDVTAVDVNPAQIEYLRSRLAGERVRAGAADRLLANLRRLTPMLGMTRERLRTFLQLADPAEQIRFWRRRFDTRRLRAALRVALSPLLLRSSYAPALLKALPMRFDEVIRRRLERAWATHPNCDNPYAWRLLLGEEQVNPEDGEESAASICSRMSVQSMSKIQLIHGDVAEYLESCAPGSLNGFSLSNVLDGASEGYRSRLMEAVRRAAADGALCVLRSFGEPVNDDERLWAGRDRSMLWGSISVRTVGGAR